MTQGFRYKAFISYSHDDERWAKWLHRSLESYRPPRSLGHQGRLKPIFRDRDELAASRDLSASIQAALADAENLIVICSRSAARSHWVNEEVKLYAALGRGDHTYCLLVDGHPNDAEAECLPEALRGATGAEPLGADLRPGADGKTGAKLKIAAALLGVRYAQLRQRDQQARLRRLAIVSASSVLGMVLAAALAGFALVSREQAIDARNEADAQRAVAVRESEIATRTTEFLVDLFAVSDPSESRGNSITAREVLDKGARELEQASAMEPGIRARLLRTIGSVYQELGLYEPAASALTKSLEIQRRLEEGGALELALALDEVGLLHGELGDYDTARAFYREALELRQSVLTPPHADIVGSLHNVALTYWRQDELDVAMEFTLAARAMFDALPDDDEALGAALTNTLANLYAYQGRDREAEPLFRELLAYRHERHGENHLQTGFAHDNLAATLDVLERWDEAEHHYRKALAILLQVYGDAHPEVAQTMGNLGNFLVLRGALDEAEALLRRAIEIHRATIGDDYFMIADALVGLASLELQRDAPAKALALADEALAVYHRSLPPEHSKRLYGLVLRADVLVALGRYPEAERLLLDLDATIDREAQPSVSETVTEALAGLYTAWGEPVAGAVPGGAPADSR